MNRLQKAVVDLLLALPELERDEVLDMFCSTCGVYLENGDGLCVLHECDPYEGLGEDT